MIILPQSAAFNQGWLLFKGSIKSNKYGNHGCHVVYKKQNWTMYRMIISPLNVVLYLNPMACIINFSKNNLEHWCTKIPPFFNYCQLIYCLLFLVSLYIIKFVIHVRNYFTLLVYEITCNVLFQSSAKLLKKREEERFVNCHLVV